MKNRTPKKENNYGSNICFDCVLACGGCEWSAVDLNTKKIRFEPVPGWAAKPTVIGKTRTGEDITSFHITACPKFKLMSKNAPERRLGTRVRPVISIDASGEVKHYASITEAGRTVYVNVRSIWAACKGKTKTAGGYRWRYAEENGK